MMMRFVLLALFLPGTLLLAQDQPTVFKSGVSMTRIDAQVLDRDGRAVTGLQINDFKLTLDGRVLPIKSLASEKMPIDILLLLDVSGSMQPHVQRIASAAREALNVLADKDRVAVMVFDTSARIRLPFESDHSEITSELNHVLRSERFNRGTRITSAMINAASYVQEHARPEARRAVVILTDDQTQDDEDVSRVDDALARANAVLSFLQAPYEVPTMMTRRRGPWGGNGGGGGLGWPGGGIGFPGGGGGMGRGGMGRGADPSHSAGTADVARDSGGDTMNVEDASALEDTLSRLRQRYALYFNYPQGVNASGVENVKVDLSTEAKIRFADAEIHYRHVYMASNAANNSGAPSITRTHLPIDDSSSTTSSDPDAPVTNPSPRRRPAVSDDSGAPVNTVSPDSDSSGSATSPGTSQPAKPAPSSSGGWPSANPDSSSRH
ncbi:MAG TPA: VWA domain-containing protein [Pirellulales bacterium]|nr:VWA domain-containing protein [Pirellulales bacterium]